MGSLASRLREPLPPRPSWTPAPRIEKRKCACGRHPDSESKCEERAAKEERERAHRATPGHLVGREFARVPVRTARTGPHSSARGQRAPAARRASEDVWGFTVTRGMCGCRPRIRSGIAWANTAASTYASCDTPANTTGAAVEACFDAAHPGSAVVATTSASGEVTLPDPSADPCERIEQKATAVHEVMHARHTEDIARAQGTTFFTEWRRLAGDPDRLNKLRGRFPAEVRAFEARWDDGHDWAQDEVNSYRWERRFLTDALGALNRICS